MPFDWSPQQARALDSVAEWHRACMAEIEAGKRLSKPVFRVFGFAGTGKAQPVDTIIPTPKGKKPLGEISVGETVFGRDGLPTVVTGVFPQGIKSVYTVIFRDGSSTSCCQEHLWTVMDVHRRWRTLPLSEIMALGVRHPSGNYRFQIPMCDAVTFPEADLPIDPYLLGVLIGDGCTGGNIAAISTPDMDADIIGIIKDKLPAEHTIHRNDAPACPRYTIKKPTGAYRNDLITALSGIGLRVSSREKHLPRQYLCASIEQRTELLRGLMDTDGSCTLNRTRFSTMSQRLADGVTELVQSLGGTCIRRDSPRDGEISLNVKVRFNPFRCARKASKWSPSWKNPPSRAITGIVYAGEAECVCISVAAADHLYLTENYIATHNTTLVKHFADSIEGKTVYGAFTGKAAMVMRQNGCTGATTLHSMIYSCVEDDQTGQITYVWNEDADCGNAALIAVDECSMVDEPMARDILRHDRPVLVLGDPAQLPPVSGAGYFTEAEPDVMLTEIHRQARDNPIIALATTVREGGSLAFGTWGNSSVISTRDLNPQMVLAADQVLVGLNKTREGWNGRMRELLGRKSYLPAPEDRLVCLKNDKTKGLFNGGLFRVLEVKPPKTGRAANGEIAMEILDLNTEGDNRSVKVWSRLECFRGGLDRLPREARRGLQEFAFGYALTVHKSQGSQWPNVLVRDESGSFGTERRRHLYTAITRASERVTIVM